MLKKILSVLLCVCLILSLMTNVIAFNYAEPTTEEEYLSAINYYEKVQHIACIMIKCAKWLGYSENGEIIQNALMDWQEAHNKQKELLTALIDLNNEEVTFKAPPVTWTGSKLTAYSGVNWGPQGKETYYNLYMGNVVDYMRSLGFNEEHYPYWVRDDGCKMLGDFIMVAANLDHWPKGSIVECSLGWAIVCDTGGFANSADGWNQLDIAVSW